MAIDPWAFEVKGGAIPVLGTPPIETHASLETPGAVALWQIVPKDTGLRTIIVRLRRDSAAPA